jgi:hypothetical protein
VNSFFTVPVIIIPKWISVIIFYDEVSHSLVAVIGWSYLFSLGRHTCICICFLSTIRCVTFFSNKWIISILCERQILIKLFSVSTTSMHSKLLHYLFGVCCVIISLYVLSSALCFLLQFPHINYVRFVVTTSCL